MGNRSPSARFLRARVPLIPGGSHRTLDTRVTQRLKASCRRRMRAGERSTLARLARGADPDALTWPVPRAVSDLWHHD